MGDCRNNDLRLGLDRRLKLKFLGSKVTTDTGLLAYRELDEALALTKMSADNLQDSRLGQDNCLTLDVTLGNKISTKRCDDGIGTVPEIHLL